MTRDGERGLTMPGAEAWAATPRGFLRSERTRVLGGVGGAGSVGGAAGAAGVAGPAGPAGRWDEAGEVLLSWGIKTRSGFSVMPAGRVRAGARPIILAGAWGVRVREPVEVVDVVSTPLRIGFSYRTLPGHPVRGEEAFILTRPTEREDAPISLTLRSLTRPSDRLGWALAFPLLLVAQAVVRRRYFRALVR